MSHALYARSNASCRWYGRFDVMISETSLFALHLFVFALMWVKRVLMASIFVIHLGMLEELGLWVCRRCESWSLRDMCPILVSVISQTSVWNVAYVTVYLVVTKLLNCVFVVSQMQLRKDVIVVFICERSFIN